MEVFNELYHFDIFLHIDVLGIFNFNRTKVKTTLSNMDGIKLREILTIEFLDYNNLG